MVFVLKILWFVAVLFIPFNLYTQNSFRVMFYNVENLFDCRHDEGKNDSEFLPEGSRKWTGYRYYRKLTNIAKVITAVGEWDAPGLIGLCEVENDSVMSDFTLRSLLRKEKYRYVMTNSPDERGIDVALLYRRDVFKLLQTNPIRISLRNNKKTRDILHVAGLLQSNDTLDVFVCHFPSRSGGEKISEGYRSFAAKILRKNVDSIYRCRSNPAVLIMGDFNDCPYNTSLYHVLNAREPVEPISSTALYNLFFNYVKQKRGTYKYRGKWEMLDQIIVSGNLLNKHDRIHVGENFGKIFFNDFLLEHDPFDSGKRPFRTYFGPKYNGGYSDHLPVFTDIFF